MSKQHYQTLFAYSWHTTERLLESAAKLETGQLHTGPGINQRTLYDLFFHMLATLVAWRSGLESGQQPPRMSQEGLESLDALRQALAAEFAAYQTWLDAQSDDTIAGAIKMRDLRGNEREMLVWRVLQHLVLHNMQHHTEIAHLLTAAGQSPGEIDFLFYWV